MVEEGRAAASSPGPRRDGQGEGEAAGSTGLLPSGIRDSGAGWPFSSAVPGPWTGGSPHEFSIEGWTRMMRFSPAVVAELSSAVGAGQLSAQDLRGDAGQGRGLEIP